jgi:hypothetical protein
MAILSGCTNLIVSGDQHLGIGATYDALGITECASPATINSQVWRANYNAVGGQHIDTSGNAYTLNAVWNVDYNVSVTYGPADTVSHSDAIKHARADGFLVVDITNMEATCSAHSYRTGLLQSPIWNFTIPVALPL